MGKREGDASTTARGDQQTHFETFNFGNARLWRLKGPKTHTSGRMDGVYPLSKGHNKTSCSYIFFQFFSRIFGPRGGCASSRLDHSLKTLPGRPR